MHLWLGVKSIFLREQKLQKHAVLNSAIGDTNDISLHFLAQIIDFFHFFSINTAQRSA